MACAPSLTINAGLRYDLQFLPDPIRTDTDNFAPRAGIVYAPGDRKTVIRASYGLTTIAFRCVRLRTHYNATAEVSGGAVVADASGRASVSKRLESSTSTLPTKPNITRIDPNIETSYSQQGNLQIERELPGNAIVSVGYIHLRARHVILSRNVNVPRFRLCRCSQFRAARPNWGNISRFESSGNSSYDGMVVSFNKRAARWSRSRFLHVVKDDRRRATFLLEPSGQFQYPGERGLSDNDQRHRLVVSGSLKLRNSKGWARASDSVRIHLHVRFAVAVQRAARYRSQSRH